MPLTDDPWLPAPDGSGDIPTYRAAAPVAVFRHDGSSLAPIANLECLSISRREGTDPGHARFRYDLASAAPGAPASIEAALGTGSSGPAIVEPGDRLVVLATRPDGVAEPLFDGEATNFAMALAPEAEQVFIDCIGIARRCWDAPIRGALMRDADDPGTVADTETDVIAHFNPGGNPNCTPDGAEAGDGERTYPTFLDALAVRSPDKRTQWTLPRAARYLLYRENAAEEFVTNPDGADLDALLVAADPGGDSAGKPIAVPDLPVTGKDWPGTLARMVGDVGFGMRFVLEAGGGGLPTTRLVLFAQQAGTAKDLYLGGRGTPLRPDCFNLSSSSLHRDVAEVVNKWTVRGALTRWEASFVLACGFPCAAADAAVAALKGFDANAPGFVSDGTRRDAYRLYVFDETGEGHYAAGSTTKLTTVASLDALFGASKYARRRRKPIGALISVDASGKPYRARLAISKDYAGTKPGLWDGTGTWQTLSTSTFHLLGDRLGIAITDTSANSWDIGKSRVAGAPYPAGVVKGVEDQAQSGPANFSLRLTCVVESDRALSAVAAPGPGSPIARPIARVVDASDRFGKTMVHVPSEFLATGADRTVRDDTELAKAEAASMRTATEAGVLDGPCEVPRLTTYYKIGDRIRSIEGRGLGLRTDSGAEGITPVYPVVVGVRWDFEGGQRTTLELSDAGTDRKRYARMASRRPVPNATPRARRDKRPTAAGGGSLHGS